MHKSIHHTFISILLDMLLELDSVLDCALTFCGAIELVRLDNSFCRYFHSYIRDFGNLVFKLQTDNAVQHC